MQPVFGRLVTAMVTPFTETLAVDYTRARDLAQRLVEQAHDGLVVAGTTGESPTLSNDEKRQLFTVIKQAVPSHVKVICGTGTNDTKKTIELSKLAAGCGADGLLLVAPYYNKPGQDMMRRHFLEVAESVDVPIMLYNIPGRTGVEISPEILAKLAEHPRIVAVKQSLPDVDPVSDLAARLQRVPVPVSPGNAHPLTPPMWIYSGDDSHTLSIMSAGGCGVVSVSGHVVGPQMKKMMDLFESGQIDEARQMHLRLFPLFKGLFTSPNPVLIKAALKLTGFAVGGLRPPLYEATEEEVARIGKVLRELDLIS